MKRKSHFSITKELGYTPDWSGCFDTPTQCNPKLIKYNEFQVDAAVEFLQRDLAELAEKRPELALKKAKALNVLISKIMELDTKHVSFNTGFNEVQITKNYFELFCELYGIDIIELAYIPTEKDLMYELELYPDVKLSSRAQQLINKA